MKTFTRNYRINHICSPVFEEYYGGLKPCVLDIEATGLNPSRSRVVLVGLLTETEHGVHVTQFLAENHYEENAVLNATRKFLENERIDYLITFNGLRYDIPFINRRLAANFINSTLNMYNFDLYRFLRKCSKLPNKLESLSQSSCEQYFGIASNRRDTISGRENAALFDEYAISGNSTVEKIILTHNREDVLQLYRLMQLVNMNDCENILKGGFHHAISIYGFPAGTDTAKIKYSVKPILNGNKKQLRICGDQYDSPVAAAYFPDIDRAITATFNKTSASYEIIIPIEKQGNVFFVDLMKLDLNIKNGLQYDDYYVNGYLILNNKTINTLSKSILNEF